jgi:RHS repeat-associated protein
MSRTASVEVDSRSTTSRVRRFKGFDALTTVAQTNPDTSITTWSYPGQVTGLEEWKVDPRFGMNAPLTKLARVTGAGGKRLDHVAQETVTPAWNSAVDPLTAISELQRLTATGSITGGVSTQTVTAAFDKAGKTVTFTSPGARVSSVVFDAFGRIVTEKFPGISDVMTTYDTRGRVSKVAQGTRSVLYAYNTEGYLSQITDPLGRIVRYTYDTAGNATQVTLPNNQVVGYSYDVNGNVTSLTPPGKTAHSFAFNAGDYVTSIVPPKPATVAPPATAYTYNRDNQLVSVDPPTGLITLSYSEPTGRLAGVSSTSGTSVSLAYDAAGRPATVTSSRPGTTSQRVTTTFGDNLLPSKVEFRGDIIGDVAVTRDEFFRVSSQTVSSIAATRIDYAYDSDSFITRAGLLTLSRDAQSGRLTGTSMGSVQDTYSYNTFGELAQYEARLGTQVLFRQRFTRDAGGRITAKEELVDSVTTTWGYEYDTVGRLVTVTRNGAAHASYEYDSNGNRIASTRGGVRRTATYDVQDRLLTDASTGYTYSYDDSGMLKSRVKGGATETFAYDEFGALVSTSIGGVSYVVDGEHRRVGKKKGGALVQAFLYQDELLPAVELGANQAVVSRFVYGDRSNVPSYVVKGGTNYRVIADHLGSPRIVIDAQSGTVIQRMDFDEFGQTVKDTAPGFQPFGFAGGMYDQDTKLVRFGARDYDPAVGRWTAKDPIGFAGGDTNLYGYVFQDPVNLIYLHGEDAADAFFAGMMDAVSLGGFTYAMGSMGLMNRVDDPCAYKTGRVGTEIAATLVGLGALGKALTARGAFTGSAAAQRGAILTSHAVRHKSFNSAMREALQWLEKRGVKDLPQPNIGKRVSGPRLQGRQIGLRNGNAGYRIEFDSRSGAHVNVFTGREKAHILFRGNEKDVSSIIRQLFSR